MSTELGRTCSRAQLGYSILLREQHVNSTMLQSCQIKCKNEVKNPAVGDCEPRRALGCENTTHSSSLPTHAIDRSPTLQAVFDELNADADVISLVPRHLLDAWLECVDILTGKLAKYKDTVSAANAVRYLKVHLRHVACC